MIWPFFNAIRYMRERERDGGAIFSRQGDVSYATIYMHHSRSHHVACTTIFSFFLSHSATFSSPRMSAADDLLT